MKIYHLLFVFVFFISCSTESIEPIDLEGSWYQKGGFSQEIGGYYLTELVFNANGSFERSLQVVDSTTNEVLGYLSLEKATYNIEETRLKRFDVKTYGLNNIDPFLPKDELVFSYEIDTYPDVIVSLNFYENSLTFDYSLIVCPANAICIDKEKFYRKL